MTSNALHITIHRVAIVAAGAVSPLGFGLEETAAALRQARDCVTPVTRFPVDRCRCKTAGQIPDERLLPGKSARRHRLHRASHMMIQALGEALHQDGEFAPELAIIGTTSGGMSYGEDYYRTLFANGQRRQTPRWIANYPPQKAVADALEEFDLDIPCQVIANACASGTNAIGHAFSCIRSGR